MNRNRRQRAASRRHPAAPPNAEQFAICEDCGQPRFRIDRGTHYTFDWPFCPHGFPPTTEIYTGRLIWLGSEVWGKKKAGSDEVRADLEAAILKGAE